MAYWKLGPTRFWLKHDLLRLEVAPSGKTAWFMTHVFHETWETLASPAKRATECLGGQADKSSNRFKPPQVIHHQEAFPFLTNKKIPTKEESFSCFVYKLLRCNPEYIRQVCNRALKRVWRDRYSCFVTQTWLLETWHRKCGKIPGSLKSMATFLKVSLYACFHKLKKKHLSILCPEFESHMLLGMCFTVMIPATYTRCLCCTPRSPGRDKLHSISEPSIPWHLKRSCKDFGTSNNFLSILIPTSNYCSISHIWQDLSEAGWIWISLHKSLSCNSLFDQHWHIPLRVLLPHK